jgi:hypothetical protein
MVVTFVMFFVLIACFVVMFGLVKFSENVIARPQLVPLDDGTATGTADSDRSVETSA